MLEIENNFNITKRNVLRSLSAFYDPLGFIRLILMSMKISFRKLCIEKLEWDAELSDSKVTKWQMLVEVLKTEEVVRILLRLWMKMKCMKQSYTVSVMPEV